jgi:hypothetical protein
VIKMGLFSRNKKQKRAEAKDTKNVSQANIKVRVYKSLGGGIRTLKAEYIATEKRDEFGELVSINNDVNHKEDVDFQMDSIYREMQILLNFKDKNPEKQEDILKKSIKKQERLIYYLDRVNELNALFNYQDEWAKLRDLRILYNHRQLDENGSYFYLDERGVRVYEFDAIDGFLIPRWHGNDTYSSYPDHTRTKKIKLQHDIRFAKEIGKYTLDQKLITYGFLIIAIGFLWSAGNGYWAFQLMEKNNELNEPFTTAQQQCLDTAVKVNTLITSTLADTRTTKEDVEFIKSYFENNNETIDTTGDTATLGERIINTLSPE